MNRRDAEIAEGKKEGVFFAFFAPLRQFGLVSTTARGPTTPDALMARTP